jgi:hypothetical protein
MKKDVSKIKGLKTQIKTAIGEALIIALREKQVMDIKEIRGNRLFSEDLY